MSDRVASRMTPTFDVDLNNILETVELHDFRQMAALIGRDIDAYDRAVFKAHDPVDPEDAELAVTDLLGLLLVAVQVHLRRTSRQQGLKTGVFSLGPRHPCGDPKVSLLNDLANAWKHIDQWDDDPATRTQQQRWTAAVFEKVGPADASFYQAFVAVLETDALDYQALEQVLKDWRRAVDAFKANGAAT